MVWIVFNASVFAPDRQLVYYGLVSYRNQIGISFSNEVYGFIIIILILLVNIVYQIIGHRINAANNIARQLSELESLLKTCYFGIFDLVFSG